MKSSFTSVVTVSIVMFAFCVTPVVGTVLRLSEYCSDDEYSICLAKYLDAELDFSVVGSTLTLSVSNLTPENEDDPSFKINKIYFNVTDNVEGLSLTDVTGPEDSATTGWDLGVSEDGFLVGGFGRFDVALVGGQGNHLPVVEPGKTVSFVFQISGAGSFVDTDFITLSSPVGGHIVSYAVAKFYNDNTSAYGATNVPEPASAMMLGLGGVFFALRRRRR